MPAISDEEVSAKIELAETFKEEAADQLRAVELAARESSLSGWIRRAIQKSHKSVSQIIEESGLGSRSVQDFMEGGQLTTAQADRLCDVLGVSLPEMVSAK